MGNSPRLKLHYVKEEDRTVTGLVQILDTQKGTKITEVDVYVIGREKISWVSAQNFMTLKESHTFFKEKVTLKATDTEPTFSIALPEDLPCSGHGGNYGNGLGYAVGYHVLVEAAGNADISDTCEFPFHLRKNLGTKQPTGVDTGSVKFGSDRTLEYEFPTKMPRGTKQTLKFKISGDANQRVRLRVREEGKQLKGQEQTSSEIKYELEDVAIGCSKGWTPVEIFLSPYANAPRDGTVLKISHVVEITAIGSADATYVNIPLSLA